MQVNHTPSRRLRLLAARRAVLVLLAALLVVPLALFRAEPRPAAAAPGGRLVWAYYVGYAANSLAALKANASRIDVLSPHWYSIDGQGNVCMCREAVDKNLNEVVQIARANNIKIVPMVLNNVSFAAFSPVLTNSVTRAHAIDSILSEIDRNGWDGIQIDFEGVSAADRQALTAFMAEIAPQVRGRGRIISQAINAKTSDLKTGYAGVFDYAALAPHSDYLTLMTYGYGVDVPRSTAPYNWVEGSAKFAASQIPPAKLLLGIGWYGNAWNLSNGTRVSQTFAQAQERSTASGVAPRWDTTQRSNTFNYTQQGSNYAVWFEDKRSQDERLDLMDRLGLGGAAFWRLGHEDPAVWDSISARFAPATGSGGMLPPYGVSWGLHKIGPTAEAGSTVTAEVTATNAGSFVWATGGSTPFRMGYHWFRPQTDAPLLAEGLELHTDLPADVPPGGTVTVPLRIQTPATPGTYLLSVDMLQENVTWFAQQRAAPNSTLDLEVTLTAPPLAAPAATGPPDGATLAQFGGTLTWQNPPGVTQYQIQIMPASNDGPAINLVRNAENSFVLPEPQRGSGNYILLPGMTYSWRVRATAAASTIAEQDPSWGRWSAVQTFRTPAAGSGTITPVAPAAGSRVTPGASVLRWADSNAAIFYYEVQVSADPRFETDPAKANAAVWWNLVHGGQTTPLNSWQTPPLTAGATYYWRVRPRVQGDGAPVEWSPAWSFRVE